MEGEVWALKQKGSFCLIMKGKVKNNVGLRDVTGKPLSKSDLCVISSQAEVKNEITYMSGDLPPDAGNSNVSRSRNKSCFALWKATWVSLVS